MNNIDNILQDVCLILQVPRISLGIFPSEKGLFAGDLTIEDINQNFISFQLIFEKINLVTHDLLSDNYKFKSHAKFVLVVEKETVLKSLVTSKVFESEFINSIVVTVFIILLYIL